VLPVLLSVVVYSFSGVMMPGLMFGVTLAKSLKSPWAGAWISMGHAVIEVPLIVLVYFGFARFFENNVARLVFSIAGSGVTIWLGMAMFRARVELVQKGKDLPYNSFIAGILTSILNPFFLLWWATIGFMLVMRIVDFGAVGLVLLIVVHWLCDLVWLSFVSNLVYRTHSLWGIKFQERLFIGGSLALAGFGVWYLISGIQSAMETGL
jgi:threonine/homoserine/homoserine lactone efflux protein